MWNNKYDMTTHEDLRQQGTKATHSLDIMDARALDWIDDKVAAPSDFQELDTLLENVKKQQDLLKQQVLPDPFGKTKHTS
jgi:hypothetical protein